MVMEEGKCWLCFRTTPSKILKVCHSLYDDPELAHEAGLKAAQLLRDAYLKDPTIVSGRSSKALIASAIYLVGVLDLRFRKTQWDVADATNAVQVTVRKCSRLIAKTLGIPSRIEQWRLLPKKV
jgi:transcription initiation factor TFIIIB Brf1 subunit/transcription initiation factor TFIIB